MSAEVGKCDGAPCTSCIVFHSISPPRCCYSLHYSRRILSTETRMYTGSSNPDGWSESDTAPATDITQSAVAMKRILRNFIIPSYAVSTTLPLFSPRSRIAWASVASATVLGMACFKCHPICHSYPPFGSFMSRWLYYTPNRFCALDKKRQKL